MDHIWYWFAYSFLGYCLEKLFAAATRSSHRLRRCFVFLPLCPVYGFAMVTILLLGGGEAPRRAGADLARYARGDGDGIRRALGL